MAPVKLYKYFQNNKILIFYTIRCFLSFFGAYSELNFYIGLLKRFQSKKHIPSMYLWITLFSAGMFISSSAYLPSTFALHLITCSYGLFWQQDTIKKFNQSQSHELGGEKDYVKKGLMQYISLKMTTIKYSFAISLMAMAAIIGWPFALILGIPMAFEMLILNRTYAQFIKWSLISLFGTLIPTIIVDSFYYGKFVLAPFNLVVYNIFSSKGPELYGVEPWHFYFVNLFLNFNLAFLAALLTLPLLLLLIVVQYFVKSKPCEEKKPKIEISKHLLILTPFYLWALVFFTQPHKEERFIFPCYSFIILNAALFFDYFSEIISWLTTATSKRVYFYSVIIFFSLFLPLSLSRSMALVKNYHSTIDIYAHIYSRNEELFEYSSKIDITHYSSHIIKPRIVCTGKDWYRFPSHFFLPENWTLHFLKSEFRAQLPKHYNTSDRYATRKIPENINDLNREELTRYIEISYCEILIDMENSKETFLEPKYSANTSKWYIESSFPFLDSARSHPFFRAFYLPYISHKFLVYNKYNVLIDKAKMNQV
ncbi:alpha-1,2-mannosyltransferase ALG9-like isoform X1 [Gordionus sp. m RMFG-2023]|uniref:alpha-1,2-mannosyltransferase ALG9-like isoform X1 n=2 Tax=Gordionus sp. m RMFG-2023 TaxID=3053472 RepID=UPI0031FD2A94